eukprot:13428-Chlamydomonas_euryale.AAC.3
MQGSHISMSAVPALLIVVLLLAVFVLVAAVVSVAITRRPQPRERLEREEVAEGHRVARFSTTALAQLRRQAAAERREWVDGVATAAATSDRQTQRWHLPRQHAERARRVQQPLHAFGVDADGLQQRHAQLPQR